MSDKKRGIHELYGAHQEKAEENDWGRSAQQVTRRGFLKGSGHAAISADVGASIPIAQLMPGGLIPAAQSQTHHGFQIP